MLPRAPDSSKRLFPMWCAALAAGLLACGPDGQLVVTDSFDGVEGDAQLSSGTGMDGVWAIQQFGAQTGPQSTFSANTLNANLAGFSARMPWKLIQTGPSTFDWTAFDALVAAAKAKGKLVRLSVMSGLNAPPQGGWLPYQYPWFTGSAGSQCDSAGAVIPVPWDSGLLNAQTALIAEIARKWAADWGSTVVAWQVTGPSARWEELCLPDNTVSQPGYYFTSATDNVLRKTWQQTMDKWLTAMSARGLSSKRMFVSVSAPPPFYGKLHDDVANDMIARFGARASLQWHFLDTGFANSVNSVSTTWKSKVMVAWQEWGASTFATRLMGTGDGTACGTGTAADCATTTASAQDVVALNASVNLARNAGATYVEVYNEDLTFPLLSAAAETLHASMVGPPPDRINPTASLSAPLGGATLSGTAAVNVSAQDNVAVTRVELLLDGAVAAQDTAAPFDFSFDTTAIADGAHTLQARAFDAAGNVGASAVVSVSVNNAPGTPTGLTATASGAGRVTLSWNASPENDIVNYGLQYKRSASADWEWVWVNQAVAPPSRSFVVTGLVAGAQYDFHLRARDAAGNFSPWTATVRATVR